MAAIAALRGFLHQCGSTRPSPGRSRTASRSVTVFALEAGSAPDARAISRDRRPERQHDPRAAPRRASLGAALRCGRSSTEDLARWAVDGNGRAKSQSCRRGKAIECPWTRRRPVGKAHAAEDRGDERNRERGTYRRGGIAARRLAEKRFSLGALGVDASPCVDRRFAGGRETGPKPASGVEPNAARRNARRALDRPGGVWTPLTAPAGPRRSRVRPGRRSPWRSPGDTGSALAIRQGAERCAALRRETRGAR